jgi:FtsP/CotA-like multicopper oxidase with cupredoxin domain
MARSKEGRPLTRRELLKLGIGVAGAAAVGGLARPRGAYADGLPTTPIRFKPFTRELPTVANGMLTVATPGAAFPTPRLTLPPGKAPNYYTITMKKAPTEILPGVTTEIWGYDGIYPGPIIVGAMGTPDVVRFVNHLDVETTIHLHGAHPESDSDGLPMADHLIAPGEHRDYLYPHQPVTGRDGRPDPNHNPSMLWYHDHATDITGPNVYQGLASVYPVLDDLEKGLIASGALPELGSAFDLPLVLQDRLFNADGSLFYSPFQHDGFLGDVQVVNGKAQPYHHVQRRKYRFRILNGTNARVHLLRLSNGAPFLQIGGDRWLFPAPIRRDRILLGMAECADVIVDFSGLQPGDVVYLTDIIRQDSGRGPGGTLNNPDVRDPGTPLVKFIVDNALVRSDLNITGTTALRPHTPIPAGDIVTTRTFTLNRSGGAWQVNGLFYDEERADAVVKLGTAERWIFKNGGGGWWHPVHTHLEVHQVQRLNGQRPPPYNSFLKDTTLLGPGDEAEVFIRFRDHPGRWVVHCHNMEHEDDRMMFRYDTVV